MLYRGRTAYWAIQVRGKRARERPEKRGRAIEGLVRLKNCVEGSQRRRERERREGGELFAKGDEEREEKRIKETGGGWRRSIHDLGFAGDVPLLGLPVILRLLLVLAAVS